MPLGMFCFAQSYIEEVIHFNKINYDEQIDYI